MWLFFMFLINRKKNVKPGQESSGISNWKLFWGCVRGKAGRMDVVVEPWIHCGRGTPLIPAQRCGSRLTVFISWSYPRDVNKCVFRLWTLLPLFVILVCCIQVQAHHLGLQRFLSNSAFVLKWNSSFFFVWRECDKTLKFWGQEIYFPANILSV